MDYLVSDPDFAARVRASFARQRIMETLGAQLKVVAPGRIEIAVPFGQQLTQQHGYFHAGVTTTIMDSSCGYAAMTLAPPGGDCLTVEFKANFVRPAAGQLLTARGQVVSTGRTLIVCQSEAIALDGDQETQVALMLATIRIFEPRA